MHPPLPARQFQWNWNWYLTLAFLFAVSIHAQSSSSGDDCLSVASVAIPDCAKPCILEQAGFMGCNIQDLVCQCRKSFVYAVPCVAASCEVGVYYQVIADARTVCKCAVNAKDHHSHHSSEVSSITPTPTPTPTAAPSAPPPVVIVTTTTTTTSDDDDDDDNEPTDNTATAPTTSTSTSPLPEAENGADHITSTSRLGLMASVFGAALAFALL